MAGNVLIAENEVYIRRLIGNLVTQAGYTVVGECDDGPSTIRAYRAQKPDLTIISFMLAKLNGIQTAELIKVQFNYAKMLLLSEVSAQLVVHLAVKAGFAGVLVKPFQPKDLQLEMQRILTQSKS